MPFPSPFAPPQGFRASSLSSAAFPLIDTSTTAYHSVLQLGSAQAFTYEGANSTGLRNGTNAQTFSVYNTYTAGTPDYERLEFFWTGNTAVIRTAASGTGTARSLNLRYGNTTAIGIAIGTGVSGGVNIDVTGGVTARTLGSLRIGGGASFSQLSGTYIGVNVDMTLSDGGTNSTTVANGITVAPTINYTGGTKTGSVHLIKLAPTNTSLPTGVNCSLNVASTANALGGIHWNNQTDEQTNYEHIYAKFASDVFEIGSVKGGSGTLRGMTFGISGNSISFYGATPVALQTGVAVTAGGIHAALVNLGLITA